jgi:multidrug efflux pump subunit AcrA (membrane-fusion protein)
MKRAAAAVAVVVVLVVGSVAAFARLRHGTTAGSLPTATVARTAFVDYLQLRGEIRPAHSTVLTAPMSGGSDLQIIQLARNGATVRAGDVVVQFDTTLQQRTLEQKQSELKQAESEIDKALAEQRRREQAARTALEQARSAVARARLDLEGADLRPRVEAEHFKLKAADADQTVRELEQKVMAERDAAAADVASARQKREKALFDVRETERLIAGMTIKAPAAGPITVLPNRRAATSVFAQSAPEFRAGDRAFFGAQIAELPDLSVINLTCRIDEVDRARIQMGRAVLVRVDALPDRELTGSVQNISLMSRPDFTQFPPTRNFDLIVALADNDARLRSGMSATARIELERLNDVLVVPAAAVFQRTGAPTVYQIDGSTVVPRRVSILRRGRDQIAIAGGVQERARIALKDPDLEAAR